MKTKDLKEIAKMQGVKITTAEAKKWSEIINIVDSYPRSISKRFNKLRDKGFYPIELPMNTGFGVGMCVRRMNNGSLRIRVSANWCGSFGNYADCVTI